MKQNGRNEKKKKNRKTWKKERMGKTGECEIKIWDHETKTGECEIKEKSYMRQNLGIERQNRRAWDKSGKAWGKKRRTWEKTKDNI